MDLEQTKAFLNKTFPDVKFSDFEIKRFMQIFNETVSKTIEPERTP